MSSASPLPSEPRRPSRDEASWARNITRLNLSDRSAGGIASNVEGRRVSGPLQGFGQMWQKTYQVRLPADEVEVTKLISTWKARFPEFWPERNTFYAPLTGITPGEVALLDVTLPGRFKLSTGVMVLYADDESFTLMTPQGHMFAGWITFSARREGDDVVAQAQVLMRASDPIFEVGLILGGHHQEDVFWQRTLVRLADHLGYPDAEVETSVVCVDKKRQWRRWGNVWHSSAIRSTIYMLGAPLRLLSRRSA
jgi:hypothetical protein